MYKFNVKTIVELKSRSCTKNIEGGGVKRIFLHKITFKVHKYYK